MLLTRHAILAPSTTKPISAAYSPSRTMIAFLIVAAISLYGAGFYYKALGCDGGWYSYPAFELAEHGTLGGNLRTPAEQLQHGGSGATFAFLTQNSIRVLYTTICFELFSPNIYAVKLLSLIELVALGFMLYLALSAIVPSVAWRLCVLGLFLTDQTVSLTASADARPDIAVAAVALALFCLVDRRRGVGSTAVAVLTCFLLPLVHVTAVVPWLGVMAYLVTRDYLARSRRRTALLFPAAMTIAFLIAFVFGGRLFAHVAPAAQGAQSVGVTAADKVRSLIYAGPSVMFAKEVLRWRSYFFTTNVASLGVLFGGVALAIPRIRRDSVAGASHLGLLAAVVVMFASLLLLDPHPTDFHAIPATPFFYLLFAAGLPSLGQSTSRMRLIAIGLALLAGLTSLVLAARITRSGWISGYNIVSIGRLLERMQNDSPSRAVIIGPTEIYPFLDVRRGFLIVDNTRDGGQFADIRAVLPSVQFVVLNADYEKYRWLEKFLAAYPDYSLQQVASLRGSNEAITVYRLLHPAARHS
ncbi:MAG: hypothetical protein LAO51_05745 [Acidobacteriia bacterium]|nr:hypothetical protein [Terriglobia bacterium]